MSDLYGANTALLLHMEGFNGSTKFVDSSWGGMAITRYGTPQISTAQSKWGSSSGYFDGTGDYLEARGEPFGTGDFTVEGWLYAPAIVNGAVLLDCRTADLDATGFSFYLRATRFLTFGRGNPWTATEGVTAAADATWYHIALTRSSGVVRGFLNGGLEFTISGVTTNFSSVPWRIGISTPAATVDAVYLQDVRVTLGIARYTEAFTPPSAKLPDPDQPIARQRRVLISRDIVDGGPLKIVEPVTRLNSPVARRVRLCDQRDGRLVREAWSDATTGDVTFDLMREGPWVLYALDHTLEFEAVALSDRLATPDGDRP